VILLSEHHCILYNKVYMPFPTAISPQRVYSLTDSWLTVWAWCSSIDAFVLHTHYTEDLLCLSTEKLYVKFSVADSSHYANTCQRSRQWARNNVGRRRDTMRQRSMHAAVSAGRGFALSASSSSSSSSSSTNFMATQVSNKTSKLSHRHRRD